MKRELALMIMLALMLLHSGCNSSSGDKTTPATVQSKPETPMKPSENDAKRPADLAGEVTPGDEKYSGPPVSVKVLQLESFPVQYSASVEITTPTGGWTLELDRGEIVDGTVRVYLTLERPGEGELVTQSLVKHAKAYTSTTPFTRAAVYIHLAQRGVSTFTTNYRLAATSD